MKLSSGVLLVFATVAAGATQAFAQATGSQRPSSGLFEANRSDANARQRLDITLSAAEAYDSQEEEEQRAILGARGLEPGGSSTMLVGGADYAWQGRRVGVGATGTSTLRYRPIGDTLAYSRKSASQTAGVRFSARIPWRTTVLLNQTATYAPFYLYNLLPRPAETTPGDAPLAAPDYAMSDAESHSYGTVMTLTRDVTRRSRLSATADYQHTKTLGGTEGRRELSSYGIRAHVSHRLAPNTAATAEYVYRSGEVGRGTEAATRGALVEHGVNLGVDYTLPLSATRSLALGGRFGPSTMMVPESAEGVGVGSRPQHRLSGQATIGYAFGRTWQARAFYRRGVEYVAGLSEPVSTDGFTASVEGLLTRRVDVLASAGYSNGESAVNRIPSIFETYTDNIRLRYALTRTFAAYVEYQYYFYDSHGSRPIGPGIPSNVERKGVRTGLTLRVPALRR